MRCTLRIVIVMVVAGWGICSQPAAWAQSTQVIIVSGDPAPGGNGTFSTFSQPALNDAGQVGFLAGLSGTSGGSTDDAGVFLASGAGVPVQIARKGQAAPDSNGSFLSFNPPALNDLGQMAFFANLAGSSGGTTDDSGIFRGDGLSAPVVIAREGQAAPGGTGTFANLSTSPPINQAGQVAFWITGLTVSGTTSTQGIFRGDGVAAPVEIVRAGQSAPGWAGVFNILAPANLSVDDAGQVPFLSAILNNAGVSTIGEAIFVGNGATAPVEYVRIGQTAPGDGVAFNPIGPPALNNVGQMAFDAIIFPMGTVSLHHRLFRSDAPGTFVEIVRNGQAAPDGNGTFSTYDGSNLTLNDAGEVLFWSSLNGTSGGSSDDVGLFRGDGTILVQIAREGQAAPGGNGSFLSIESQALNNAGQVAFFSTLAGTGGGASDDAGIFFFDGLGLLEVIREGDMLLGSSVTGLGFNPSYVTSFGEERSGLNELGQVAYQFDLADGRHGIAIWTVPEPGAVMMLSLVPVALLLHRRAKRSNNER